VSSAHEIVESRRIDPVALLRHVVETWHAESVVAHGQLMYPATLPGFVALRDGEIAGHVSYRIEGPRCEIVSIDATPSRTGIGTLLLEAALSAARRAGCTTAWLTTTNDNLDALRFYQRRGFRVRALRPGAVDCARADLKPQIPAIGSYGIPIRDELDLELELGARVASSRSGHRS
jgi:ribosomal protein S18 acetylase RimI-like enzyme